MSSQWKWLTQINKELFDKDPFLVAFDCFSVFAETKGILVVISDGEVINIKFSVTGDPSRPLKCEDMARIKEFNGLSVVRDNRNSFILSKNGSIHAFKSFKRITELSDVSNVKFFNCFQKCYVLIEQVGADCKLHLYKSFGDEFDASRCEFDLSFPIDAVSADSSRDSELCVEMIEGKLQPSDERFFAELLACDLSGESICDVLLLTSNDRLMWIKYQHGFNDGALDGYSIELITTAKGNIRGLKYGEGFLISRR